MSVNQAPTETLVINLHLLVLFAFRLIVHHFSKLLAKIATFLQHHKDETTESEWMTAHCQSLSRLLVKILNDPRPLMSSRVLPRDDFF